MNKFLSIIVAASVALSLTSCLKDDEHFVDFAASGYVAEIPYVANRSILKAVTVLSAPTSATANIAPVDINIASPNPPTTDIPVGVGPDPTALDAYNKSANRAYKLLPSSAYQLTPSVTVASGSRIATVNVTFIPGQIPTTGGPYALALSILTVPSNVTISANYRTQILAITLK